MLAHFQAGGVNRRPIDQGIGTGQIDIFEDAGIQTRIFSTLLVVQIAVRIDENRFTRHDIPQKTESESFQCDRFAGHHIFRSGIRFPRPDTKRTDAVRIAESQNSVTGNMGDSGIGTTNPFVENGNGTEKCGRIQRITVCRFLHFVCQHVQQDFRVRTGIDVATVIFEHFAFQLLTIGQIAVMGECNAERGIDVKRLRFLLVLGGTGCRITDMPIPQVPGRARMLRVRENVPDQTGSL